MNAKAEIFNILEAIMKKRIFSLLLIACLLITGLPVMGTVAAASTEATESTPYDYSTLYVTRGLLGLYTAYLGDSTVDLTNGKWADASGKENDATIGGTWTAGAKGGFGYNLAAKDNSYLLSFPSNVLPTDEYELEIIASVRGLLTA